MSEYGGQTSSPPRQAVLLPEGSPLLDELGKLDIEGLSPIEALNKLWEWKNKFVK